MGTSYPVIMSHTACLSVSSPLSASSPPSLRIHLPEHVGVGTVTKKYKIHRHSRYFTWEEVADKSLKAEKKKAMERKEAVERKEVGEEKTHVFSQTLWNHLLQTYSITAEMCPAHRMEYSAFLRSSVYRHPEAYPHTCLYDLMVWYIEEFLLGPISKNAVEWEAMSRRRLLRSIFRLEGRVWSPPYYDVYMKWVGTGAEAGKNRYQKMVVFMELAHKEGWF